MSDLVTIWLDDERDPNTHDFANAIWFKTGEDLITWFQQNEMSNVSLISLDHDLGDGRMTGYDVLVWIEEQVMLHEAKPPMCMKIHTQNPVGRDRMNSARHSIYKPK